jgi:hypothetical protein
MLLLLPLLLLLLLLTMQSASPLILEMKLLHVIGQVATAQITLTSYLKHKGTEPAFTAVPGMYMGTAEMVYSCTPKFRQTH